MSFAPSTKWKVGGGGTPSIGARPSTDAFSQRLRELGWVEGSNVAIDYRWAEGRNERMAEIATEFVRLKVDVIVTTGTPATLAAKQATYAIPIVFVGTGDPVGTGLVASLAQPGGNITGLSNQTKDLAGKRVELLREVVTGLRRLAILANVGNPASALEMGEVQSAARTLGVEITKLEIRRAEDIAPAFEVLASRADAIYVMMDTLLGTNLVSINTLAASTRLPTMHGSSSLRKNLEIEVFLSLEGHCFWCVRLFEALLVV